MQWRMFTIYTGVWLQHVLAGVGFLHVILNTKSPNDLRPDDGLVKRAETCSKFKILHLFYYYYYACPITLGNTTCWVIIGCTSGSILRCVTLHCSELIWSQLCYSKSKSIDSTKVMNGFRNFVINSCLLIGQCPGWTMFFFRVPLCFARSLHWYNRWSTIWSPCLQTHVALSNSLNTTHCI